MRSTKLPVWPACDMSLARSSGAVADFAMIALTPPASTSRPPFVAGRSSHLRSRASRGLGTAAVRVSSCGSLWRRGRMSAEHSASDSVSVSVSSACRRHARDRRRDISTHLHTLASPPQLRTTARPARQERGCSEVEADETRTRAMAPERIAEATVTVIVGGYVSVRGPAFMHNSRRISP